jgi:hypothetical protein
MLQGDKLHCDVKFCVQSEENVRVGTSLMNQTENVGKNSELRRSLSALIHLQTM